VNRTFGRIPVGLCCPGSAAPVLARSEAGLEAFFEGKPVTPKIDLPGTSDGVESNSS